MVLMLLLVESIILFYLALPLAPVVAPLAVVPPPPHPAVRVNAPNIKTVPHALRKNWINLCPLLALVIDKVIQAGVASTSSAENMNMHSGFVENGVQRPT
jgi:hypothetical protein